MSTPYQNERSSAVEKERVSVYSNTMDALSNQFNNLHLKTQVTTLQPPSSMTSMSIGDTTTHAENEIGKTADSNNSASEVQFGERLSSIYTKEEAQADTVPMEDRDSKTINIDPTESYRQLVDKEAAEINPHGADDMEEADPDGADLGQTKSTGQVSTDRYTNESCQTAVGQLEDTGAAAVEDVDADDSTSHPDGTTLKISVATQVKIDSVNEEDTIKNITTFRENTAVSENSSVDESDEGSNHSTPNNHKDFGLYD